jgi:hypothetical protein
MVPQATTLLDIDAVVKKSLLTRRSDRRTEHHVVSAQGSLLELTHKLGQQNALLNEEADHIALCTPLVSWPHLIADRE